MATIFREQNLDRVSNTDTLDDYIHIASPGVWMVLIVIILLLAAGIIWGFFGTVNVDTTGVLVVEGDATTLWLGEDDARELTSGMRFKAADEEGMVTGAAGTPEAVSEVFSDTADNGQVQLFTEGAWVCPFPAAIELPAGVYPAAVTLQSFSPLELIFGAGQSASVSGEQSQ